MRQEAIQVGHINRGAKIHFKLGKKEAGWFAVSAPPSSFLFAFSDHNGTGGSQDSTYCIGFGYNDRLTDPRDSEHIVDEFHRCLRPRADVQGYLTHDWAADPYAKGVWACWGPGAAGRFLAELQRPHGRVVFASGDSADAWRGFIDGAIEQGKKAAREVRAALLLQTHSSFLEAKL